MFRKKAASLLGSIDDTTLDFSHIKHEDGIMKWVEQVRCLKGVPFSFQDRSYLQAPYTDMAREINIVKPRQMEVTEFGLNWLLFWLTYIPFSVGLYMSDRQDHVGIFSKLRLQSDGIDQSPYLQSKVKKGEHNVSWQPFNNGSHLWMYSAWGDFEAARSIPVDFAVVDEMQSINVEALPVLKESMSKSKYQRILKIGTGSDEGDDWYNEWHNGTQYKWDAQQELWLQQGTESVPGISSYQFTQYMGKWILPDAIEYKRRTYTPRRFTNEVEGWWFKGMRRPLTDKEMRNLFDKNLALTPAGEVDHTLPIFAGFDWGGGTQAFTVAWIWQLVSQDVPRFKLLHIEKIDDPSTEKQADQAIELMRRFQVDRAVMDAGGGIRQVEKMSKVFGSRVYRCSYHYDSDQPWQPIHDEHRVLCDRTWIIETIIDLIKRPEDKPNFPDGVPRIHLPYKEPDKVEWLIDHFTCIEAETANNQGKSFVRYTHPESLPDDVLHAACYAYLAYLVAKKIDWRWERIG